MKTRKIAVVGLGYVGLPLAVEFGKTKIAPIIGFDIDSRKINELKKGIDRNGELTKEELTASEIEYSDNPGILKKSDFVIVAVPTPIEEKTKKPDLSFVESASNLVGQNLTENAIVVFESTVYPGVTEDICVPIIEKESGLKCGSDWKIGYSPERVNPGDKEHTIDKVMKIVAGMDDKTLDEIAVVYSLICEAGVHRAPNIKTAEAAKVIENVQRDLNIALVNELSLIFRRLGINTKDVLDAAATKWNFHKYQPGLVGGHCIGVDPYYLTYLAEELGYKPQVILAGRHINDYMPEHVTDLMLKGITEAGKSAEDSKVLVMGLTFKENVRDVRNSKAKEVIHKLKEQRVKVYGYDPLLSEGEVNDFGVENIPDFTDVPKVDGIIVCSPHSEFKKFSLEKLNKVMKDKPVLVDVKSFFSEENPEQHGFIYKYL